MNIDLSKGFSTFVGSNGSGKSNVIDALCFVLGKASKKSMRADMLSDLIFNGGKHGRPAKFAEVGLVFDNANKAFPYEGEEFKISRRVLDKGNSIFKINDKLVKRQEILNALTGSRINPDGFNIILQGDIQKFVDLSGEERRKIIEDVSGISVYEDKKKKSIRELEKVEDKLKEARVRLAERERYLKEIINDKKQAEKYLKMQEELKDKKAGLLFKRIHDLEQQRTTFDEKIKGNNDLLKESENKINILNQEKEELEKKLEVLSQELASKGDAEQQAISRKLERVKNKKLELENVINNHTREINRIKQRKTNINTELKEVEFSIINAKDELKSLVLRVKKSKQELDDKRKSTGVDGLERTTELKEELYSIEEELSGLNNELLMTEQSREYLLELEKAENKLEGHEVNLKRVNNSLTRNDGKRTELYTKKREVDDYLNHLISLKAKLEAKKDVFIDYGTRGVKAVLKADLPGVHGTLSSLGLTDKRFSTALNVAAGSRLNAIITTDDVSAQKCIEHLRATQSGTAAFIPLNKVKDYSLSSASKKLKRLQGVIDFAINLIKFDEKYRKAFELVLRDTLVVHDLDVARRIGFDKVRMVTEKGDVVDTSGLMTGGYRGKSPVGFMNEDVDKQLTETESKTHKYERYKKEVADALSIIEEEVIKDREAKARFDSLISELKETIERLKTKTSKVSDISELTTRIKELSDRKKVIKKELSSSVDEKVLRLAKEEVNQLEAEHNELVIEHRTKKAEFEKVLIREKERFDEIITELDNESEVFKKELIAAKQELVVTNSKLKELKDEESKFYKELKGLYDARDNNSKSIEANEKHVSNLQKDSYSVKEKNQDLNIKRASIVAKLDGLRVAFEEFKDWEPRLVRKPVDEMQNDINRLDIVIRNFGPVNMKSIETYKEVEKEFDKIKLKTDELGNEKQEVINVIMSIESRKKKTFLDSFKLIKNNFERIFAQLSPGGIARLLLENRDEPLEGGITAIVRPKGKKILTLKSMSGGEKTLTALAFIFSIQEYSPTPFYIMDEVDAALDKANTEKLAEMLAGYSKSAQFVVISHNDDLISASDYLYGVSMDKRGVSNIVSIKLPE